MVSICLKARCKYKKQALFLSCFGVYTDFSYFLPGLFQTFCCVLGAVFEISAVSATFCLVFSGHFAVFWVLFWGFLQFQLLFLGFSLAFGLGFGCCFRSFRDYSSPSPSYCLCYQPMAIEHYANLVLLS